MKHSLIEKKALQKIFQMQCEICKALGHPLRLAIVDRLSAGEAAASDLIADLGISKANLSKHMSLLTHSGIVESRRSGNSQSLRHHAFYSLPAAEGGGEAGVGDSSCRGSLLTLRCSESSASVQLCLGSIATKILSW
jgi:DNA-binding transcriptional ArsR family regulator